MKINLYRLSLLALALATVPAQSFAKKHKEKGVTLGDKKETKVEARRIEKEMKPADTLCVYAYAASFAFGDSVLYMSDVIKIDKAPVSNGSYFLDREFYADQFKTYVETKERVPMQIPAVYFSTKEKRARKMYAKTQQRCQKKHSYWIEPIGTDKFSFSK